MIFVLLVSVAGFIYGLIAMLVAFFTLGVMMSEGKLKWYKHLLVIPVLGPIFEHLFQPPTYYKIDTALMFQESVRSAILEVIDEVTKAKGLRALSVLERKPILTDLLKR